MMCCQRGLGANVSYPACMGWSWFMISKKMGQNIAENTTLVSPGIKLTPVTEKRPPWKIFSRRWWSQIPGAQHLRRDRCPRNIRALGILLISWPSQKHTILQVAYMMHCTTWKAKKWRDWFMQQTHQTWKTWNKSQPLVLIPHKMGI